MNYPRSYLERIAAEFPEDQIVADGVFRFAEHHVRNIDEDWDGFLLPIRKQNGTLTPLQEQWNARISHIRAIVERKFLLKNKYKRFSFDRKYQFAWHTLIHHFRSACALENLLLTKNFNEQDHNHWYFKRFILIIFILKIILTCSGRFGSQHESLNEFELIGNSELHEIRRLLIENPENVTNRIVRVLAEMQEGEEEADEGEEEGEEEREVEEVVEREEEEEEEEILRNIKRKTKKMFHKLIRDTLKNHCSQNVRGLESSPKLQMVSSYQKEKSEL